MGGGLRSRSRSPQRRRSRSRDRCADAATPACLQASATCAVPARCLVQWRRLSHGPTCLSPAAPCVAAPTPAPPRQPGPPPFWTLPLAGIPAGGGRAAETGSENGGGRAAGTVGTETGTGMVVTGGVDIPGFGRCPRHPTADNCDCLSACLLRGSPVPVDC